MLACFWSNEKVLDQSPDITNTMNTWQGSFPLACAGKYYITDHTLIPGLIYATEVIICKTIQITRQSISVTRHWRKLRKRTV